MNKLENINPLIELAELLELYGTFIRPDSSGVRMGLDHPLLKRSDSYPYDYETSYGQPMDYDRGSGGSGPSHNGITPRNTEHSIWDDLEEVMGSPILLAKAYQGAQIGHATGVPGASGQWANNPIRSWDDNEIEDALTTYGEGCLDFSGLTLDPTVPDTEPVSVAEPTNWHDQTDDEVEKKLDRIWGRDNNSNFSMQQASDVPNDIFVSLPIEFGLSNKSSYNQYDLMPKKSAWMSFIKNKL